MSMDVPDFVIDEEEYHRVTKSKTEIRYEEIEARLAMVSTDWRRGPTDQATVYGPSDTWVAKCPDVTTARFVAHAPNDLRFLCDENRRMARAIAHAMRCGCPMGDHEINLKYCVNCGGHCLAVPSCPGCGSPCKLDHKGSTCDHGLCSNCPNPAGEVG